MKKKRQIIIIVIFLCGAFLAVLYTKKIKINHFFVKNRIQGVDISHYQGNVDMEQLVRQQVEFVFIKATEGSKGVDEMFHQNWDNASGTELLVGAYHFFSFDSDGKAQAQHYIETVGDLQGKLVPVVDVEYYGDKEKNPPDENDVVRELDEYLLELEQEYHVKPVIYTTQKVYRKYIRNHFAEYPLWLRNVYYPVTVDVGKDWSFWQYSDTEILSGYEGKEKYIDMNVYCGSKEELQEMIVKTEKQEE